ncbi:MAG: hypothetical protein IKO40_00725 [Kiritimatiellae bacterium]|nr:hypothetical protein [Kiritimatiellia bacterium]
MKTHEEQSAKPGTMHETPDAEAQGWFMPDCPHCGSSRHVIREDIADRAISWARGRATTSASPRFKCCACRYSFS